MNDTTFWNLSAAYGVKASDCVGKVIELKGTQFRIEGKIITGITLHSTV